MIKVTDNTEQAKGMDVFGQKMAFGERMALGLVQDRKNPGMERRFFLGVLDEHDNGLGIPMKIEDARALIERMTSILDRCERGEIG